MVSLNRPEERTGGLIPEEFDETVNYRVQLDDLELKQATYPKAKPGEMSLVWHLRVFDQDGTAFLDPNTGDPWDLWEWSDLGTWSNPNTGKKAKARTLADAFMGHELSDEEVDELNDAGWENALVGKYALGSFEIKAGNDGSDRVRLLKMRAYRERRQPAAVGAPTRRSTPPDHEQRSAQPDRRRPRDDQDALEDLPF